MRTRSSLAMTDRFRCTWAARRGGPGPLHAEGRLPHRSTPDGRRGRRDSREGTGRPCSRCVARDPRSSELQLAASVGPSWERQTGPRTRTSSARRGSRHRGDGAQACVAGARTADGVLGAHRGRQHPRVAVATCFASTYSKPDLVIAWPRALVNSSGALVSPRTASHAGRSSAAAFQSGSARSLRPLPTKAQTRNAGHGHGSEGQRDQLGGAESRCERHVEHAPIADAVTLLHVGCSKHRLHLLLREMTNELCVGLLRRDPEADLLDIIHVVRAWIALGSRRSRGLDVGGVA